jgi:hypothetical protein
MLEQLAVGFGFLALTALAIGTPIVAAIAWFIS